MNLFTEDNGSDADIAKVVSVIAFFAYIGYAGYGLYQGHFALGEFGQGLMLVLFGCATIITGKNFSTKGP